MTSSGQIADFCAEMADELRERGSTGGLSAFGNTKVGVWYTHEDNAHYFIVDTQLTVEGEVTVVVMTPSKMAATIETTVAGLNAYFDKRRMTCSIPANEFISMFSSLVDGLMPDEILAAEYEDYELNNL